MQTEQKDQAQVSPLAVLDAVADVSADGLPVGATTAELMQARAPFTSDESIPDRLPEIAPPVGLARRESLESEAERDARIAKKNMDFFMGVFRRDERAVK